MSSAEVWKDLVNDAIALVKQFAHPKRRTIAVSPEVAAMLEAIAARGAENVVQETPVRYSPPKPSDAAGKDAGAPSDEIRTDTDEHGRVAALAALAETVSQCRKCGLCETRTQTVFSDGSPLAELVFVGEAPGADEDRQGLPFVGRAGQLLTDIIVKGMKIPRSAVYICNVLKCRPPENRNPRPDEVEQCEPYLIRQLQLIRPKAICALGTYAAQTLLRSGETVGRLRGKWHRYQGIPLRVTYHPAYLLRNPADKAKTWADIQEVMKLLDGTISL